MLKLLVSLTFLLAVPAFAGPIGPTAVPRSSSLPLSSAEAPLAIGISIMALRKLLRRG